MTRAAAFAVALACALPAAAVELPPTCAIDPIAPDTATPLAELKRQVEAVAETDPDAAISLMCATIPRVARERGQDSADLAWWVASLATPLIAYKEQFEEAIPLLEFARPIFERRLGPTAAEVAEIHVAWAWIRFRQGRLADARASWESALRVREQNPGPKKIELQKILVGLAQAQLAQGDFPAARLSLDRAHAILVENGETESEAAAAIENAFTNLCLREENYAEARRHAETQIAIEGKLGRANQTVPAYSLLGRILERLDEYEASEQALREAVRLSESDGGPLQRHQLAALTLLGSFLDDRGKPDEALAFEQRALALGEATLGPEAPRLVRILNYLADAQRATGRLADALHTYERAGAILERHPADVERPVQLTYFRGFGLLQLALGEADAARATLERGLAAAGDDPTVTTDRAAILVALASTREPGDPGRRPLLAEALALDRARLPETHPTILRVINDLCGLEIELDPTATPDCTEAAARIESGREVEPALREAVLGNQCALAERRGDAEAAHRDAVRAVAAAAALGTPDPAWRAKFRLARLLEGRGEPKLAIFFGKESIAEIERMRGTFVGDDRRFDRDFIRDKVSVYRAVADWLMGAGRIDEGLDVLRLLKTEEMYDFALRAAAWQDGGRGVLLTDEERALRERYERALDADLAEGREIDRLSRLREAGRLSVKEKEELERRLAGQAAAESGRAGRLQEFLSGNAAKAAPAIARAISSAALEREMERFGADSALAFYLLTDTHLRVLVATKKGESEVRIPLDGRGLQRDIGNFLAAIERRDDVLGASRALYETIVRPVDEAARKAGAKRLVLWLDGALRYVPFAALHDGKRYLSEAYAIELHAGSATAVSRIASSAPLNVRGLGLTQAVAGYRPLPAVADELCNVVDGPITGLPAPCTSEGSGAIEGSGYADLAFTRARFEGLLTGPRDFSVLHLGTHFSLRPGNAMRSYLVLGDGSKLTLDAIGALDFAGIELLTLSACQTGLAGAVTEDGREVEGLAAMVARRGARRVVASLWEVEDVSTATLMRDMYRSLRSSPEDVPRALQRAQGSLRSTTRRGERPYQHPYYWAGFVVSGK